jgi:hypothetical protein
MRRISLFFVEAGLVFWGGFLMVFELGYASRIYFLAVAGGGVMVVAGLYLLWTDFIGPLVGAKETPDA